MKKIIFLLVMLAGWVFADALNDIVERGELRVGISPSYVPFEMKDKRGELIGLDVDVAKAIGGAMGVKVKFIETDWDGIIPGLLTNKYDIIISAMAMTSKRNLRVDFINTKVPLGQSIVVNNKHSKTVRTYEDLNDPKYEVAVLLGDTGYDTAKKLLPKAKIKTYESIDTPLLEVMAGNADAVVFDTPYMDIMVKHREANTVFHLEKNLLSSKLGWAINKNEQNFKNWLETFVDINSGFEDSLFDKLENKWIRNTGWVKRLN